jgi:aerobic C4-dicarboxylate transport protein
MQARHAVTAASRKPLYSHLYVQVLTAIIIGIVLGYFYPELGEQMKPFGDASSR